MELYLGKDMYKIDNNWLHGFIDLVLKNIIQKMYWYSGYHVC